MPKNFDSSSSRLPCIKQQSQMECFLASSGEFQKLFAKKGVLQFNKYIWNLFFTLCQCCHFDGAKSSCIFLLHEIKTEQMSDYSTYCPFPCAGLAVQALLSGYLLICAYLYLLKRRPQYILYLYWISSRYLTISINNSTVYIKEISACCFNLGIQCKGRPVEQI